MSLIVEDGTGKADAESYCSVAAATAYHAARGNDAWDNIDNKEAALRNATDYMRQAYGSRWKGVQINVTQALDWPRFGAEVNEWYVPADSVPVDIINACAALALRTATATDGLMPDAGAEIVSQSVGPISTTYAVGARQGTAYKAVNAMVARYLEGGGNSIKVTRA